MSWKPRDHASFTHALLAMLPVGEIWPRDATSTLVRTVTALALLPARWAERVATFLLVEAFPPSSNLLLSDWERVLGLPEPCLPVTGLTIAERHQAVLEKLQRRPGRQDRWYFIELAARLGYVITITEFIPAQGGMTPGGAVWHYEADGALIVRGAGGGSPYIRFVWRVHVMGPRLTWFACGAGGGRAGQDPHLKIRRATDLECLLQKFKPAHTKLVFSYEGT